MKLKSILEAMVQEPAEGFGYLEKILHTPLYPITEYHFQVSDTLWRGSWPSDADLAWLKSKGIHTCVNLCAERLQVDSVIKLGLLAVNVPILDNDAPTVAQAKEFVELVGGANAPAYVHCEQGKGRTGCMVAAYRILAQGWKNEAALHEAVNFGLVMPEQQEWVLHLTK